MYLICKYKSKLIHNIISTLKINNKTKKALISHEQSNSTINMTTNSVFHSEKFRETIKTAISSYFINLSQFSSQNCKIFLKASVM